MMEKFAKVLLLHFMRSVPPGESTSINTPAGRLSLHHNVDHGWSVEVGQRQERGVDAVDAARFVASVINDVSACPRFTPGEQVRIYDAALASVEESALSTHGCMAMLDVFKGEATVHNEREVRRLRASLRRELELRNRLTAARDDAAERAAKEDRDV